MATAKYSTAKAFDFAQTTPAVTWVVDYKFPYIPIVEVLVDNPATGKLEKMLPKSIEQTNSHTVTITFSSAHTGRVHIVG